MRYFFFAFNYHIGNTDGFGNVLIESEKFPPMQDVKKRCETAIINKFGIGGTAIVIIGFYEFKNKEDFDNFAAGQEPDLI